MSTSSLDVDRKTATSAEGLLKVSFYVFFAAGGIGRYTSELLRALSRSPEVEIEVICSPEFQWKESPEYAAWAGLRNLSHPFPLLRRVRFLTGQFVNPARAVRHAVDRGTDVLHFSNINHLTFPFWKRLLERSGLRVAVTVHDVRRQKRIINRVWEDRQLKAVYRFADVLFVHSEVQAQELVEFAGVRRDRIVKVPHGPYPYGEPTADRSALRARYGLPQDRQVALFFGQIRDEKNLEGLMRAAARTAARPHLLVAGQAGGSHHRGADFYERLAAELGLEDRITFLFEYIPDEAVGDLFTAADWVALPYRNYFTSQSGVLNVAAHYERPVLVSSSPVLRETVQTCDIGVVCSGDNVPAIAQGIEAISARVRQGHAHEFDRYREEYSWAQNARRSIEVYASLVSRPKQRD